MLQLYNTLTRKTEVFTPVHEGMVGFYHCGPTVYWRQHIGNLRGMTMGDILVRTLRYLGYAVNHVRNYTDVGHLTSDGDSGEDKMEKGAKREGMTPDQIADKYIALFESDTKELNLLEPTHKPRATQYIREMIDMVSVLLAKGYAYETDLAVYYDVSKFADYTRLSGQKREELVDGAGKGTVEDSNKKNPLDFAVWFFKAGSHANALQTWPSPFHSKLVSDGRGFPGWHIECSAMSKALIGPTVDIHWGGIEHIPVHHTNEIAQSEAVNGVKFVNYWLHNEHLVVNNEKMAKSAGTGMSLEEVISQGFDPVSLRYFFLTAQYRSKQNFTYDALTHAANSLKELRKIMISLRNSQNRQSLSAEKEAKIEEFRNKFSGAMENDLNTPQGLAVLWEMLKSNIPSSDKYDLAVTFDEVLGLGLSRMQKTEVSETPAEITDLAALRETYRTQKNFAKADEVRIAIEAKGYVVEDTPQGPVIKPR